MSLLMEALKKAEQAKQGTITPPEETALSLEPAEAPEEKPSFPELDVSAAPPLEMPAPLAVEIAPPPLPPEEKKPEPRMELALEPTPLSPAKNPAPPLEPKAVAEEPPPPPAPKSEPRPAAPSPRPTPSPSPPEAAKQQARNVFSAKTGVTPPPSNRSKHLWLAIGVGSVLMAAGIGYYFYRQLNPPSPAPLDGQPAAVSTSPSVPESAPDTPFAKSVVGAPAMPLAAAPPSPPAEPPQEHKASEVAEAAPVKGDIRIQRGAPAETLNPNLTRAYHAMEGGNLAEAQEAYRKVLQSDRNNRDALLGLAVLQERKGETEGAARLYQRLLELDPNDSAAQAGLIGLGQGDPVRSESRLKSLLAQQPDSDVLHFALANLYAGQQRWAEAQQAYFRAFQKQPGNPDYLYNLAVSLDHLGQNKLAREYYRKALAATDRPHNFSPDEVRGRVDALEKAAP